MLLSFDKSFYYLFPATAVAMATAFYVIKTYQSVFERRMRTLQFRSPGIAPGNADESAPRQDAVQDATAKNRSAQEANWKTEVQLPDVDTNATNVRL